MRVVHVQTQIQTVFGVIDDDGNVIAREPIGVAVQRFAPEAFLEAYGLVEQARNAAAAEGEPEPVEIPAEGPVDAQDS